MCASDDNDIHAWDTLKTDYNGLWFGLLSRRVYLYFCNRYLGSLKGHENRVTSISLAPNGMALASCSWDNSVRVWVWIIINARVKKMKPYSKGKPISNICSLWKCSTYNIMRFTTKILSVSLFFFCFNCETDICNLLAIYFHVKICICIRKSSYLCDQTFYKIWLT